MARRSLRTGFERAARSYADGWHDYLGDLRRPRSVAGMETAYDVSLMVLAAAEDKTYRGGAIASPSNASSSRDVTVVPLHDLRVAASDQTVTGARFQEVTRRDPPTAPA